MRNDSWFLNIFITLLWDRLSNEHQIPRRKKSEQKRVGTPLCKLKHITFPQKETAVKVEGSQPIQRPPKARSLTFLCVCFLFFANAQTIRVSIHRFLSLRTSLFPYFQSSKEAAFHSPSIRTRTHVLVCG